MHKQKETIGDCTLYLGDCMEVMPELGVFDAVVTDPPYGMGFVSGHRKLGTKHMPIANDGDVTFLKWASELQAIHSKYIFMRWENLQDLSITPKSCITWVKDNHSMGDLEHEHGRQTEICAFYAHDGHKWPNKRPNDVIKCARTGNNLHPTEKPVSLMEVIVNWTLGGIVDPFMGSGTTGVACAKLGRKFTGIELEQKYFDIACKRIEEACKQPDMFVTAAKETPIENLDMFGE